MSSTRSIAEFLQRREQEKARARRRQRELERRQAVVMPWDSLPGPMDDVEREQLVRPRIRRARIRRGRW